jgi:hypothetical protein
MEFAKWKKTKLRGANKQNINKAVNIYTETTQNHYNKSYIFATSKSCTGAKASNTKK